MPGRSMLKRFVRIGGFDAERQAHVLGLVDHSVIAPRDTGLVRRLIREAAAAARGASTRSTAADEIGLASIAWCFLTHLYRSIPSPMPAAVTRAMRFMHRNLDQALVRKEIADHAGVNEVYLGKLFAGYVGLSPMDYFEDQRLRWAASMIESTMLSIKEVAPRTGFDDPLYFSTRFRERLGVSSKAWRER
jgi:AraC family transcriptional regulator of arabinose operon